jgi:hypothetical protein
MKPYRDQYGVLNVEDKPRRPDPRFWQAVKDKVARSAGVGGWRHGPVFICEQAQDEQIDTPAWLRGLNEFPKPPGADALIADIGDDAEALFKKIEKLRGLYEP